MSHIYIYFFRHLRKHKRLFFDIPGDERGMSFFFRCHLQTGSDQLSSDKASGQMTPGTEVDAPFFRLSLFLQMSLKDLKGSMCFPTNLGWDISH